MKSSIAWFTNTSVALALVALSTAAWSVSARAGAQEDQQACMNDALTVCSQYIPDRERVAGCLISNRSRISPTCRMALTQFNPKTASPMRKTARR